MDDEPDAAWSEAELLAVRGYDVRVALCGEHALRQAAAETPDVVLLDLNMPGMDGWQVARLLRDSASGKQPVIVAVTGCGWEDARRLSADAGIDLHVLKPADPGLLLDLIDRLGWILWSPPSP